MVAGRRQRARPRGKDKSLSCHYFPDRGTLRRKPKKQLCNTYHAVYRVMERFLGEQEPVILHVVFFTIILNSLECGAEP